MSLINTLNITSTSIGTSIISKTFNYYVKIIYTVLKYKTFFLNQQVFSFHFNNLNRLANQKQNSLLVISKKKKKKMDFPWRGLLYDGLFKFSNFQKVKWPCDIMSTAYWSYFEWIL